MRGLVILSTCHKELLFPLLLRGAVSEDAAEDAAEDGSTALLQLKSLEGKLPLKAKPGNGGKV